MVSLTCVWLRAVSLAEAAVTLSVVKAVGVFHPFCSNPTFKSPARMGLFPYTALAAIVPGRGVVLFNEVSVLSLYCYH